MSSGRLESQAAENVALKHRAEGYRNEAGALESRLALIKAQRNKLLAAFEGFAGQSCNHHHHHHHLATSICMQFHAQPGVSITTATSIFELMALHSRQHPGKLRSGCKLEFAC